MKSQPLLRLGAPTRVRVTKVVRTSWRIEWEYDGQSGGWIDDSHSFEYQPSRMRRVRHMQGRGVAYRAAAMRYIFTRRDRYAKEIGGGGKRDGCMLCETAPIVHRDGEAPDACRYHDADSVERLRSRLARWLLWRDTRAANVEGKP